MNKFCGDSRVHEGVWTTAAQEYFRGKPDPRQLSRQPSRQLSFTGQPLGSNRRGPQISEKRLPSPEEAMAGRQPVLTSLGSRQVHSVSNSHERKISFPSPRGVGKDISVVKMDRDVKARVMELAARSDMKSWYLAVDFCDSALRKFPSDQEATGLKASLCLKLLEVKIPESIRLSMARCSEEVFTSEIKDWVNFASTHGLERQVKGALSKGKMLFQELQATSREEDMTQYVTKGWVEQCSFWIALYEATSDIEDLQTAERLHRLTADRTLSEELKGVHLQQASQLWELRNSTYKAAKAAAYSR